MEKRGANRKTIRDRRFAVLYGLISNLEDAGKIQIQKLIYFLQEGFGVETKYVFKMHHYGPYSEELEDDLDKLKSLEYISIRSDPTWYGYHIQIDDEPATDWLAHSVNYQEAIERTVKALGDKDASELELAATIHFVHLLEVDQSEDEVITVVKSLKPKFTVSEIESARSQLLDLSLLNI